MRRVRVEVRQVVTSGWTYAALWALSRAILGCIWATTSSYIMGDVTYYLSQVTNATSWSSSLVEYPTPVAWAMQVLYLLTGGNVGAFVWAFATSMLVLDAVMARLLWRLGSRRWRIPAILTWILFVSLLGPLAYFRFDMAPAVLAGAGALLVRRRPALAGALIACGAALKLWPALLVLPLLGMDRRGRRSAVGFTVTGGALALASLAVGGWQRLLSPLTWQSSRGLQIESLPATALMWLRTATRDRAYTVGLSRYNAYEIVGPGTQLALQVADVATVLGFVLAVVVGTRAAWTSRRSTRTVATVMLSIILIMIVVNKTLSPQYVLWLGGPLAALVAGGPEDEQVTVAWPFVWTAAGLVLAYGTQLVYPLYYGDIVYGQGKPLAVSVLVLRNVALLVCTVVVTWKAWRLTRPVRRVERSLEVEATG